MSAARSGSAAGAGRRVVPAWPGVARSSSREASRGACPPRSRRAARRARRSLAPVTGRASTCSTACSPSPSAAAAPASARSGSAGRPVRSGRISARASRSVPPVASTPAGSAGPAGAGGDGVRAGPGRFHGPLDQAGRDDARHPHADLQPAAGPAGPGVFPAQVRLAVPPAGPGRAQQPGQVPPQRLGACRVGLRRGEDDHLPGTVGEHLVAAAPQPRPPGDHRGGGCGQHRARGRTPRGEGVQQQPGQPGGRPAGVGHVPAQRPARPARRDQQPVPGHGSMSSSASPGSGGAAAAPAGCWRACRRAISAGSLVHQAFSSGEASASKETRADGPAARSPVPLAADRSRARSPAERRNSAATLAMACGDWRSRIWVAELAMTARPRSVPGRPRRPG